MPKLNKEPPPAKFINSVPQLAKGNSEWIQTMIARTKALSAASNPSIAIKSSNTHPYSNRIDSSY